MEADAALYIISLLDKIYDCFEEVLWENRQNLSFFYAGNYQSGEEFLQQMLYKTEADMAVKFEKKGSALRVMIQGDFDMKICAQLKKEIDAILDKEMVHQVIFDLTFVPFIDSSGLGVILGRYRKLAPTGGKVSLVGANR